MKVSIHIQIGEQKFEYALADQSTLDKKVFLAFVISCARYVWANLFSSSSKANGLERIRK